ncbi:hypothetical protein V2J09_017614 [Rumex salicifolius]
MVKAVASVVLTPQATSALQKATESPDYSNEESAIVDWDNLGFGLVQTDFMYSMKCSRDADFVGGQICPYRNIELNPAAAVLNYGQGIFEGLKAYRREDGRIVLFRPDQNAMRMKSGAERVCMPCPSTQQFIDAVKQTVLANKRWIPPPGKGSLYIRPLLIGTGPTLGVAPSTEYTFLVYACPEGTAPLNLFIEDEFDRASQGGAGGVKTICNYAPGLKPLLRAKSRGYSDVLYLDSVNHKYVEEVTACNVFIVKDNTISTPAANGTILPGITRRSIAEIARDFGYKVEERLIPVEEVMEAGEVFCTGTAVVVAPVGSVTYCGRRVEYRTGENSVCNKVKSTLVGIQNGVIEDNKGWVVEL